MKEKILIATFTVAFGLHGAFASDFDEQACAALKSAKIYDTKISEAIWNQSGEIGADKMSALTGGAKKTLKAAPHCIIHGEIASRTGSDGKHYGIKFELRLPGDWNGKLLFQGGGGLDGFVAPALGAVPIRTSSATPALMRGYAVVTTDSGHPTPTPEFGLEQQARLDYAYQAIGKVSSVSKQLVFAPSNIAFIAEIFSLARSSPLGSNLQLSQAPMIPSFSPSSTSHLSKTALLNLSRSSCVRAFAKIFSPAAFLGAIFINCLLSHCSAIAARESLKPGFAAITPSNSSGYLCAAIRAERPPFEQPIK